MIKEKVLEPFYTIIKIALLNFYPDNTKIAINNNEINTRLPSMYQGILRWSYGEDRSDLKYIEKSILFALKIIDKFNIKNINSLLFYLYSGLNKLTLCYIEDDKYKKKLQQLEMIIKDMYEVNKFEVSNSNYIQRINDFDYNKVINFWKKKEIDYINHNFLCIEKLYKLDKEINLENKKDLREYYITIIKKILNIKNELFIKDYLGNSDNFYTVKIKKN